MLDFIVFTPWNFQKRRLWAEWKLKKRVNPEAQKSQQMLPSSLPCNLGSDTIIISWVGGWFFFYPNFKTELKWPIPRWELSKMCHAISNYRFYPFHFSSWVKSQLWSLIRSRASYLASKKSKMGLHWTCKMFWMEGCCCPSTFFSSRSTLFFAVVFLIQIIYVVVKQQVKDCVSNEKSSANC